VILGVDQTGMLHESFNPNAFTLLRKRVIEGLPSKPKVRTLDMNWAIKGGDNKVASAINHLMGIVKVEDKTEDQVE